MGPLAAVVGNFRHTVTFKISSQEQRDRRMEMIQLFFEYGADPIRAGWSWALHEALRDLDFRSATLLADKGARIIVSELTTADQARLDQAVVKHEWGTVMGMTPPNWSFVYYAGPGMVHKEHYILAYRLPAGARGNLPPCMKSEIPLINEAKVPLPSRERGNNFDETGRT